MFFHLFFLRFWWIWAYILEPQLSTIALVGPPGRLFGAVLGHLVRSASNFCPSWLHFWSSLLLLAPFLIKFAPLGSIFKESSTNFGFTFWFRKPVSNDSGIVCCSSFLCFCFCLLVFLIVCSCIRSLVPSFTRRIVRWFFLFGFFLAFFLSSVLPFFLSSFSFSSSILFLPFFVCWYVGWFVFCACFRFCCYCRRRRHRCSCCCCFCPFRCSLLLLLLLLLLFVGSFRQLTNATSLARRTARSD